MLKFLCVSAGVVFWMSKESQAGGLYAEATAKAETALDIVSWVGYMVAVGAVAGGGWLLWDRGIGTGAKKGIIGIVAGIIIASATSLGGKFVQREGAQITAPNQVQTSEKPS